MHPFIEHIRIWLNARGATPDVILITLGIILIIFFNFSWDRISLRQPGPH